MTRSLFKQRATSEAQKRKGASWDLLYAAQLMDKAAKALAETGLEALGGRVAQEAETVLKLNRDVLAHVEG